MYHDISKLWDQVQQISLSQRVTKNELEANMGGLEAKNKMQHGQFKSIYGGF